MDDRLRSVIPINPFNPLRQQGSLTLQASGVPEQGRLVREQIAHAQMVKSKLRTNKKLKLVPRNTCSK